MVDRSSTQSLTPGPSFDSSSTMNPLETSSQFAGAASTAAKETPKQNSKKRKAVSQDEGEIAIQDSVDKLPFLTTKLKDLLASKWLDDMGHFTILVKSLSVHDSSPSFQELSAKVQDLIERAFRKYFPESAKVDPEILFALAYSFLQRKLSKPPAERIIRPDDLLHYLERKVTAPESISDQYLKKLRSDIAKGIDWESQDVRTIMELRQLLANREAEVMQHPTLPPR
eukprot:TRINITY_DN3679_c0_g2_i1.p2 TRINITY_DN3679_c0_g2~~TRINITY_DN3679_c0_g2_i1.p2  ORF type:complete len:227 (+),score=34.23 TRINITY_DN3679_c0_g2_i1:1298-1978(+)